MTESIVKKNLTHRVALNISDKLNVYLHKEGIEKIKLQYGMEMLIMNVTKLLTVLFIAVIFGIFFETLITLISFNLIRTKAFGLHAKNSISCLLSSALIFLPLVYLANYIVLSNIMVIIIFVPIIIIVAKYAPSDTEKRPIIGIKKRKKLKRQSINTTVLVMFTALIIPLNNIKNLIVLGAIIEVVTLLPLTYIILGRKRNNYEEYERNN